MQIKQAMTVALAALAALVLAGAPGVHAQQAAGTIAADGTVNVPAF